MRFSLALATLERRISMPSDSIKSASVPAITDPHPNLDEEIRRLAYEFYETRGREDGHDVDDWLRAEAEVTGTAVKIRAAA
jgi:hypothetical protein